MINVLHYLGLFIVSMFMTYAFAKYAPKRIFADMPNSRSSHVTPVVRGGGIVFVLLWVLSVEIASNELLAIVLGSSVIAGVGFLDDIFGLPVLLRFVFQLLVSCLLIYCIGGVSFELAIVYVFAMCWSVNLFNFMDGVDGIAAVEAIFVFGAGGVLFMLHGGDAYAMLSWSLVAVVAGFLVWNYPRARVFMGDVGSYFLGLLVAIFAIVAYHKYNVPIICWLVLYGTFLFDSGITLARRILMRQKFVQAHRSHAYQRLQEIGWSHKQILFAVTFLNILLAIIALGISCFGKYWIEGGGLALAILVISYCWVERLVPMKNDAKFT